MRLHMSLTLWHRCRINLTIGICSGEVQITTLASVTLFKALRASGMNIASRESPILGHRSGDERSGK